MILALFAAWGACGDDLPEVAATQSVVWVSPLGKRTSANAVIRVVPIAALKDFAATETLDTARLLQLLGLRKSPLAPKRLWKVTVFEASSGALCRPIAPDIGSDELKGLPICSSGSRPTQADTSCGRTRDRRTGGDGIELYKGRWRDLAPRGFCVLPTDRFTAEL